MTAIREMVMLPENRPAMLLLLRSSVAMCSVPVAVYYFCFDVLFGPQGWIDLSHDLNWRVNYSGFAAIAAVQVQLVRRNSLPPSQRLVLAARKCICQAWAYRGRASTEYWRTAGRVLARGLSVSARRI